MNERCVALIKIDINSEAVHLRDRDERLRGRRLIDRILNERARIDKTSGDPAGKWSRDNFIALVRLIYR